jgi:sulfite exporter TauE/SafE
MNWWAILAAGLLAGATTCAATQGGLLVGLIARQKKAAAPPAQPKDVEALLDARKKQLRTGKSSTATGTLPPKARTSAVRAVSPTDDFIPVVGFLAGKLLVLTVVGLVLGGLGSLVVVDSRIGVYAQLLAGAVMIALGLSTMGVPGFDQLVFSPPESWTRTVRKSTRSQSAFAPFLLGVATVLIPCGVTISMMLLAATAGSAVAGGAVMFVFVLGTAPLFAAYGYLTQRFVKPDSRRMGLVMGGVVVAMGLFTVNAFLVATAAPFSAQRAMASVSTVLGGSRAVAAPAVAAPAPVAGVQTITINATSGGYEPSRITAKAGVETKLVLHTDNTQSCIVYTVFPTLDKHTVLPPSGDTEVDLGVLAAGEVPISCSMGMYTGTIVVS